MKFLLSLTLSFIYLTQTVSVFAVESRATERLNQFDDPPGSSASPTPDPELEEAKRNALLAEEKKKKAEAEKAEVEARRAKLKAETDAFGDPSKVSVPSGGVQTDQEGFVEVKMLSLEAARNITQRLTSVLCRPIQVRNGGGNGLKATVVDTLVIYDDGELEAVTLYRSMVTQLEQFKTEFAVKQMEFDDLEAKTNPKTNSADPKPLTITTSAVSSENNSAATPLTATSATAASLSFLGAAAIPGVATGIITSIAQLANLFRTETNFQNKDIPIPEDMVVSYIISNLNSGRLGCPNQPAIYYPRLYPARLFRQTSDSELLKALGEIAYDKRTAADNVKKIEARIKLITDIAGTIEAKNAMEEELALKQETRNLLLKTDTRCRRPACTRITAEIAALKPQIDGASTAINEATANSQAAFEKKFKGWVKNLNRLRTLTQFLIDSADQITNKLDTPDEATKMTALAQLLRAEQLSSILHDDSTFMLRVAVSANGTTKIKKNLFVDAKVRHTAGANLVYQLFDHDGRVVMGDAMQYYFDYKSATDVRDHVAKGQEQKTPASQGDAAAALVSKRQ